MHSARTQKMLPRRERIVAIIQLYCIVFAVLGGLFALLVYALLMGAWQ